MRSKNTLKLLVIFVLVLVLGVGYAVINSTVLNIGGEAAAKTEDLQVVFTGDTDVSNSDKVIATAKANSLSGEISVRDLTLNESVTATYTIKNEEVDVLAKLTQVLKNSNPSHFSVTTNLDSSTYYLCPLNDTYDLIVTVTMIKTPIVSADNSTEINIDLTATPGNDLTLGNCS
jgi:hypothetical protein